MPRLCLCATLCLVWMSCRDRAPSAGGTDGGRCALVGTGSQCNAITPAGGPVQVVGVREQPPVATGGELPEGFFVLVEKRLYAPKGVVGPTGEVDDFTLQLIGTGADRRMELVQRRDQCPPSRETLKLHVEGARIESELTCPPCSIQTCRGTQSYSWDGRTLTVLQTKGDETTALVFKPLSAEPTR